MPDTTIAVLPFVNMSSDEQNEYFSDGMTEEIINALARIDHLKVTSRTSSFFFKNKKIPLLEIAEQLGVEVILEGSIRRAGDTVRITAQLIQARDDFHFWSETWDRQLTHIFEIQDEISLLIADKLREQFGHFELRDHLVEKQTESLAAYEYTLKANFYFNKWNPTDVHTSIGLYEKAVELDPDFTEPYVGLADAYGFLATTEFLHREEAWAKAVAFTQKAYSLNPQHAGVHYQLANLSFFTDCNYPEAFMHAQKAIELKPNYPEAQQFMAFLYMLSGEMKSAEKHLEHALSIDPLSPETLFYKAYFLYKKGDFQEALQVLDDILAKNPKNIPAHVTRCYCLLLLGSYDEVIAVWESMPEEMIIPDEQLGLSCLAYIMKKDASRADEYLERLKEQARHPISFQAHSYLYLAYANLGKADAAFEWLEEALALKSSVLLLTFGGPLSQNLHEDARFKIFKKRLYYRAAAAKETKPQKAPLLDEAATESCLSRLMEYIHEEQPYLSPGLSLRSLADQVQIHPNQLSWLLNQRIGKNFNEFINSYRVEHFKTLAIDPSNAHISLLGLAYESGFNSKTVFNTYFKKEVGMTPKAFLRQQK
jgi:adenylate cyclase